MQMRTMTKEEGLRASLAKQQSDFTAEGAPPPVNEACSQFSRDDTRATNRYVVRSVVPSPTVAASLFALNAVVQAGGEVIDRAEGMLLFAGDTRSARKVVQLLQEWTVSVETRYSRYGSRQE